MPDPAAPDPTDDDRPRVAPLAPQDAAATFAALTAAERQLDGELVDEAERRRLAAWAAQGDRAAGWHPLVASRDGEVVGYGGVVLPAGAGGTAVGDAAPLPGAAERGAILRAVLEELTSLARQAGTARLEVWIRRAASDDLDAADTAGLATWRRLGILGRSLPVEGPAPTPAPGVTIRAFRPDEDDVEVVRVLAAAYAGTADAGWDLDAFRTKRGWDWFRPEDLLLAEGEDGRLLGLHWLKRRDATTGEVHNLAVDPAAQGRGVGPLLLRAGLDHLTAIGCDGVLLWVDRANERAVHVYERQGFTTRWDDVAVARDLSADDA